MSKKKDYEALGVLVLEQVRTQLYLSMRFMGEALGSLSFTADLSTRTIGTDAAFIRFHPRYVTDTYVTDPFTLNRAYLHMVLHCLFRHMYAAKSYPSSPVYVVPVSGPDAGHNVIYRMEEQMTSQQGRLFDLCADIAVESIIDAMQYVAIRRVVSDVRERWYRRLNDAVQVLTAEKLYREFTEHPLSLDELEELEAVFHLDDHGFWERIEDDETQEDAPTVPNESMPEADRGTTDNASPALRGRPHGTSAKDWEERAKKLQAELHAAGAERAEESGSLSRMLSIRYDKKTDYRAYLKRFSILREETAIDPDSFDYGFYQYGMSLYGNMPLIEENEFRVSEKVQQLVIAIDTSASCDAVLVQEFLNETARILLHKDQFFRKAEIRIIECDNRVQNDLLIRDIEEMARYADAFEVRGGYGTDFRPVFSYINEERKRGGLKTLKGLMYFTDGFGIYPETPAAYDTAFVFCKDEAYNDEAVPGWAMKVYI